MTSRARRLWAAILLVMIAGAAFFVRTYFPFDDVFTSGYVNFRSPDSWYHMRLVDHTIRNFPHRASVDPYLGPGPAPVSVGPLLDLVIASAALIVGLGSPSPHRADVVAAFVPPLLGTLAVVAAYAIGRRLFGQAAGLFGAALLAIMPGHLLERSLLGHTDHHVLEVLLSATTMFFLMVAVAEERHPAPARWFLRIRWSVLAGLALTAYLLTWTSGAFLVFVIWLWVVVQCTLDAVRRQPSASVVRVTAVTLLVALVLVLALQDWRFGRTPIQVTALGGALATVVLVAAVERVGRRFHAPRLLLPVALVAGMAGGAALVAVLEPGLAGSIWGELSRLQTKKTTSTVGEVLPLVALPGLGWFLFGSSVLGLGALPLLAYHVLRRQVPLLSLMFVWSLVMLAATLAQNRFGYYLAFNLAVLSGHLCAMALDGGVRRASWLPFARPVIAILLVAGVIVAPNVKLAVATGSYDVGIPAPRHGALRWLRQHSPEPFADPDHYYARYETRPGTWAAGRTAYTVMAWWDYGYDVIRIARRVPAANPTQAGAHQAARFFLATDERVASRVLAATRSRYVLVTDRQLYLLQAPGVPGLSFYLLTVWAGRNESDFVEDFFERRRDGALMETAVFLPDYYRTMASRLYLFGGEAVTPRNSTWVISYTERGAHGHREILSSRRFATYEEARAYLEALGPGQHALVGRDPRRSPVPLPALRDYVRVHDSADAGTRPHGLPSVRIFEVKRKHEQRQAVQPSAPE